MDRSVVRTASARPQSREKREHNCDAEGLAEQGRHEEHRRAEERNTGHDHPGADVAAADQPVCDATGGERTGQCPDTDHGDQRRGERLP